MERWENHFQKQFEHSQLKYYIKYLKHRIQSWAEKQCDEWILGPASKDAPQKAIHSPIERFSDSTTQSWWNLCVLWLCRKIRSIICKEIQGTLIFYELKCKFTSNSRYRWIIYSWRISSFEVRKSWTKMLN